MVPSTNKRGRPRDEMLPAKRREEILDAAAPFFAAHGYAHADVQVLADQLQVGKGTIYRYFPSKRDLFLAAVDRGMNRMHERVMAEAAAVPDPVDRIARAIGVFLAFFEEHPELVELFIQERAHFKDRKQPAFFAHRDAHVGPWLEMYRQMVEDGRVRDLPVGTDQDVVNDLLYGTLLANHFTGRRVPSQDQARNIVDLVFRGILTDAERNRRYGTEEKQHG